MSEVTRILTAIDQGDAHAVSRLLPLVYDELHRLAAQKLANEKPGQTLQATALVHEAYLRLVGDRAQPHLFTGACHFFAAAAKAMRRILIDNAAPVSRRRSAAATGSGRILRPWPHRSRMKICWLLTRRCRSSPSRNRTRRSWWNSDFSAA